MGQKYNKGFFPTRQPPLHYVALWKTLQIPQDTYLQTPEQFVSMCHLRTELQLIEGI